MAENRGRDAAKVWRTKNRGEGGPMRHMRVDRGEKREKRKSEMGKEKPVKRKEHKQCCISEMKNNIIMY